MRFGHTQRSVTVMERALEPESRGLSPSSGSDIQNTYKYRDEFLFALVFSSWGEKAKSHGSVYLIWFS